MKLKHKIPTHGLVHTNWDPICHVASDRMSFENTWQVMDNLLVCWLANLFIEWPWPLAFTEVHVQPTLSHIKFQSNQAISSGEEGFLRFLRYMVMEAILVLWPGPFEQTLDPLLPRCCIWNLIKIGPVVSEEKSFENVDKHSILVTLGQGQWMTLTFDIHRGSCSTYFNIKDYHCFGKMQCLTFSKFNIPRDQIWPWQKWVKVNIGSPFEEFSSTQSTDTYKFQANQPSGSGEEDVLRFLPYMGMEAMLIMWPWPFEQISDPHIVRMLQMKFD